MNYYFEKELSNASFDEAIQKVTEELKKVGFGVLTEIDIQKTFKNKLNVDFRKYRILGACNPAFAHRALQSDMHVGTMLPCNVVVMENDDGSITVSVVDPVSSMLAVEHAEVKEIAREVQKKMQMVIDSF
jgi:uncharacterized protein (DUF302 family)